MSFLQGRVAAVPSPPLSGAAFLPLPFWKGRFSPLALLGGAAFLLSLSPFGCWNILPLCIYTICRYIRKNICLKKT